MDGRALGFRDPTATCFGGDWLPLVFLPAPLYSPIVHWAARMCAAETWSGPGKTMNARLNPTVMLDRLSRQLACFQRRPQSGLTVHSRRGCRFGSKECQDELGTQAIRSAMSRKADCRVVPRPSLRGDHSKGQACIGDDLKRVRRATPT